MAKFNLMFVQSDTADDLHWKHQSFRETKFFRSCNMSASTNRMTIRKQGRRVLSTIVNDGYDHQPWVLTLGQPN